MLTYAGAGDKVGRDTCKLRPSADVALTRGQVLLAHQGAHAAAAN
jgi:hypothetical protein